MRDVDDLHHAVDEREPQRGGEEPRRIDEAVDPDGKKLVQAKSGTDHVFPKENVARAVILL
jgi:hypothetical protein